MTKENKDRDAKTPSPRQKAEPSAEKRHSDAGERNDKPDKGNSKADQDRARNERIVKDAQQRGADRRQLERAASDKQARAGQEQGTRSKQLAKESADAKAAKPAEKSAGTTPEKHSTSSNPGANAKKQRDTVNSTRQKQQELERLAKDPTISDLSVQERIGGKVRSGNVTSSNGTNVRLVFHDDGTEHTSVRTESDGRGLVHTSAETVNGGRISGYIKKELHGRVVDHFNMKGLDGGFRTEFWTREGSSKFVDKPARTSFHRSEKSVSHGQPKGTVDTPKSGGMPEKNVMPRPERSGDGKSAQLADRPDRVPQLREHDRTAAHGDKSSTRANGVHEPSTWESLIPVWGSGKQAVHEFQQGNYVWGTVNGLLAVSDLFLVGAISKGLVKGGLRLGFNPGLLSWRATRKWYGKYYSRFSPLPKYTQVHHVFLKQGTKYRWLPDAIENAVKNHPLNLKPILATTKQSSQKLHTYIHHGSNPAKRWWLGHPGWAKNSAMNMPGHLAEQARNRER